MPSEDLYADAAPAPQAPEQEKEVEAKDTSSDSQTAELPKAVLGGKEFKPGEEVMLQVVQVNEDSVVVKYASEEHDEEPTAPEPKPAPAPGSMQSLME